MTILIAMQSNAFESIGIPTLVVFGIAVVLGILIVIVSHVFRMPTNAKRDEITAALPGANCGGCGYPGCEGYAQYLADGGTEIALCAVGGEACIAKIAEILGKEPVSLEKTVCVLLCQGTQGENGHTKSRYDYRGTTTCSAAATLLGGPGSCTYGCLGFGDCVQVCAFHAIRKENGIVRIDPNACTACGVCVKACPKQVLTLLPVTSDVAVLCKNSWPGAQTRQSCDIGCIGCRRCEKVCPSGAIIMNGPLATVNQEACTHCGECERVCPTKSIGILRLRRTENVSLLM